MSELMNVSNPPLSIPTEDTEEQKLKERADDLARLWNDADKKGLIPLREEYGDCLYKTKEQIEKITGEWYQTVQAVHNL